MENTTPAQSANLDSMIAGIASLFSDLNVGLFVYHLEDPANAQSLKLVYVNRAASAYTGTDLSILVGTYILEAFPGLAETDLPDIYAEVATTKRPRSVGAFEYPGDERVEHGHFAVKAFPMPNTCVGIIFDNITTRKRVEELVKRFSKSPPPKPSSTVTEQHKATVARFVEAAFEQFDPDSMDNLVTADFHAHPWAAYGIPDGPEGMKQVLAMLEPAFSNAHVTIEDVVAEGDRVAVRYVFEADHTGALAGIEATNKRIRLPGILIARLEGDKLAEYWREENQLDLMQQLGS